MTGQAREEEEEEEDYVVSCSDFLFGLLGILYTTTFGPVRRQDIQGGCNGSSSPRSI